MKFKMIYLIPISIFGLNMSSFAQEKKEKTRIVIKSDNNGKVTTKEMSFDKKLSQEEIDKLLKENATDSLEAKVLKKNKKVTITVDENGNVNKNIEEGNSRDFDEDSSTELKTFRFKNQKFNREEIGRRGRNFVDELPYKVQRMDDFLIESFNDEKNLSSIKDCDVFVNNPRTESINLKFRTTKKEKVTFTLVDLFGKVVAQDSVQDFIGDYFGQMKVDKNLKGNFILIITQGENGESIKVNLKLKKRLNFISDVF